MKLLNKTILLILSDKILNKALQVQTREFTLKLKADGFEIPFPTAEFQIISLSPEGRTAKIVRFKSLKYQKLQESLKECGILVKGSVSGEQGGRFVPESEQEPG